MSAKLLALVSFLGVVPVAHATKMVSLVRGAGAGSDKAAAFVSYYARYLLANDGRYDMVDLIQPLGAGEAEAARKAFADAEQLTTKAQTAYESLDLDQALQHLADALEKYEKNAAQVTDLKKVADTLMLFGAVHILRGEEKTGAERLTQALAIYPNVEPDPRVFNPQMRQIFQKASDALAGRQKGSLQIASNPSYTEVYVDGVFKGVTPTTVEKVTDGRHYVRLVKDGYKTWGGVVTVSAGKQASETGALKPLKKLDAFDKQLEAALEEMRDLDPDDDDPPSKAVLGLEPLTGGEQLFLAEVRLDGERVKLLASQYDLKERRRLKTATHVFAYSTKLEVYERELSDLLRTQFGETTLSKKSAAAHAEEAVASEGSGASGGSTGICGPACKRTRNLALGVGIGAGVVLGGLGGLFDFLASRDNDTYLATPQRSAESESLRSSGQFKALLGDILVPLGVVALGVGIGTYLFYGGDDAAAPAASVSYVPLTDGGFVQANVRF